MNQTKVFVKEFCNTCSISFKIDKCVYSRDVDNLEVLNSHCSKCIIDSGSGWQETVEDEQHNKKERIQK